MLMDMFYENVKLDEKKRVHFNAFMLDVHSRKYTIVLEINMGSSTLSLLDRPKPARVFYSV